VPLELLERGVDPQTIFHGANLVALGDIRAIFFLVFSSKWRRPMSDTVLAALVTAAGTHHQRTARRRSPENK